jgi:two-component system, LuxR family, sensor kinase FixL
MPDATVSEARLSTLLDTAVDGIVLIDEQARILVFNKACERLYGYEAADVLGRSANMLMPEDHPYRGNVPAYVEQLVKVAGVTREEMARHRDGSLFPVEVSLGQADTPEGRQFIAVVRDLRPRREIEARLAQLQSDLLQMARVSAMDEMGAAVAHELNQPLTALMLYLQAVARSSEKLTDGAVQPQLLAILEKAVHEAERAGAIVQRMRQFVERHEPARQLVDLRPLLDEAIELIQLGNWPRPDITRDFAADLPAVLVDPVQIQQILVNLLRNALRAVKDHAAPEIRVTARTGANLVAVTVTDNGAGIPAERVPTLFKAFASNKGSGLGLGLAISRTIAQTHGGDLTVDPGGDGRGACLTLHLPLPVPEEAGIAGSIRLGAVNGPDAGSEVSDARRN